MRIISLLDWPLVLCDVASVRVELSYISAKVRGEPNVALTVGNQSVGAGVASREGIFLKILRCWVKAANLVGHLFREPQIAILAKRRVVRMCALGGHIPLANTPV